MSEKKGVVAELPRDVAIADRKHRALVKLIQRSGINGLDPNSQEGKWVGEWATKLEEASDNSIPPIMKAILVEQALAAMLIARSALTFLSHVRAPSANLTPSAEAKLKAYNAANASWRGSVNVLTKILAQLGVGNQKDDDKVSKLKSIFQEHGIEIGDGKDN